MRISETITITINASHLNMHITYITFTNITVNISWNSTLESGIRSAQLFICSGHASMK